MRKTIIKSILFLLVLFLFTSIASATTIISEDFNFDGSFTSRGWIFYSSSGNYEDHTNYSNTMLQYAYGRNTTNSVNGGNHLVYVYSNFGQGINEGSFDFSARVNNIRQTKKVTNPIYYISFVTNGQWTSFSDGIAFYNNSAKVFWNSLEVCNVTFSGYYDVNVEFRFNYYTNVSSAIFTYTNGTDAGSCINIQNTDFVNVSTLSIQLGETTTDSYEQYITDVLFTTTEADKYGLGTYCNSNVDCITGYCLNNKCDLKGYNFACSYGYECLSGVCENGYCSKIGLADSLTMLKNDIFGDDIKSSNIVSLVIIISIVGALSLINIILGIFSALLLAILLSIMGWLSPFILIGIFILFIGGIVSLFFFGGR